MKGGGKSAERKGGKAQCLSVFVFEILESKLKQSLFLENHFCRLSIPCEQRYHLKHCIDDLGVLEVGNGLDKDGHKTPLDGEVFDLLIQVLEDDVVKEDDGAVDQVLDHFWVLFKLQLVLEQVEGQVLGALRDLETRGEGVDVGDGQERNGLVDHGH